MSTGLPRASAFRLTCCARRSGSLEQGMALIGEGSSRLPSPELPRGGRSPTGISVFQVAGSGGAECFGRNRTEAPEALGVQVPVRVKPNGRTNDRFALGVAAARPRRPDRRRAKVARASRRLPFGRMPPARNAIRRDLFQTRARRDAGVRPGMESTGAGCDESAGLDGLAAGFLAIGVAVRAAVLNAGVVVVTAAVSGVRRLSRRIAGGPEQRG